MKPHQNLPTLLLSVLCLAALPTISALSLQTPVIAQTSSRSMEVRRVIGNVTFRNSFTRAKSGDRLTNVGQGLSTGSRSSAVLALDAGIGTVSVSAKTSFLIKEFNTTSNGGKVTVIQVTKGQVRVNVRPFTNPQSRLQVKTPAGIAGVRGTEFGVAVADNGQTNVLTNEGSVAVSDPNKGETVEVNAGYATIVVEGEAPTEPVQFIENLDLEVSRARLNADGVWEMKGKVDPFNFIWIDDEQVQVQEDGSFEMNYARLPQGLTTVRMLTPLGSTKTTYLFVREESFPIQLRGEEDEFAG
ncbi:FecR domain-containing protein [[Leptolyngbya] sp. PCC 7376]|uniref:FecR family protein n=1 Tax=[Leptolyngbya] sp. PCC 7376 TaxID=111781 RepID=UPI00031742E7|nr:FecR family protein [[Leptolyngbya] sp. PCC 7376]